MSSEMSHNFQLVDTNHHIQEGIALQMRANQPQMFDQLTRFMQTISPYAMRHYSSGAVTAYSYLNHLPKPYHVTQDSIAEHERRRDQLPQDVSLDQGFMNLMHQLELLRSDLSGEIMDYLTTTDKEPKEMYYFLLGAYDVVGMYVAESENKTE